MKKKFVITVIGAGGTGTYFLKEFSRFLSGNVSALNNIFSLLIVDGDVVEKKNLQRQTYAMEDIGVNKAFAMTGILNEAFQLDWQGYGRYLTDIRQFEQMKAPGMIPVLIGCTDNLACRLLIEQFFSRQKDCIYIDAANEYTSGEVVYAVRAGGKEISPPRSFYFPEIKKGDDRTIEEMGCEELNSADSQHITANMQAALLVLSAVCLLLKGEVPTGMSVFDVGIPSVEHFNTSDVGASGYLQMIF